MMIKADDQSNGHGVADRAAFERNVSFRCSVNAAVLPSPNQCLQLVNPYEPLISTVADDDAVRHDRIATARRRVLIAIFLYLCILPLNILFTRYGELVPYDGLPLVILVFAIFGFASFSVYSISSRLRTKPTPILMALAALIPLLGFVVLLYAVTLKIEESTQA